MAMLEKEISAQPKVLNSLLTKEKKRVEKFARFFNKTGLKNVFIVARGSSDNAGIYAKYLFGTRNRMVVAMAAPSIFTMYKNPPVLKDQLVLAISQSGQSEDLCQVISDAARQGAHTVVVTNRPSAPIAADAEYVFALHAGVERSVAATKTYTAELMAMAMLSVAMEESSEHWSCLDRLPEAVYETIQMSQSMEIAVQRYRYAQRLAVIGRGYNYCTAFELSLKLKELAYVAAEASSSADFRHGPIAVVQDGFPVLLVAPRGKTFSDIKALAATLRQRNAELVIISDSNRLLRWAETPLPIPSGVAEWLSPLVSVVPGQLFARHMAEARGCPLDRPRGLSKITTTR